MKTSSQPIEARKAKFDQLMRKYPNRIPVIVEKREKEAKEVEPEKKYLLPHDMSIGQFMYKLRKDIKLSPDQAIFLFIGNRLQPSSALLSQVYKENKHEDGFLYAMYSKDSTFG